MGVTLSNSQGGTEQKSHAAVPNEVTFSADAGTHLYISAQNEGGSGDVTVAILVDGAEFKTSSASGAYTIATASGVCP